MIFTEEIKLSTIICDEDDLLTLWGLARLFQDVAEDHSKVLGVGYEDLKPQGKAWILTHVYYNIVRLPMAGERLTLKSWPKPDNGLIAPRDYQLIDNEGKICASSTSNWVILDTETRRVARLRNLLDATKYETIDATQYSKLEKLKMPEGLQEKKSIDVPYSAIDHTGHVNNAEYMKWICDSIEEVCKPRRSNRPDIKEFAINYLKETKYGDQNVKLSVLNNANDFYFQINNSNGISVNAKVVLG